ncbi:Tfp pilus assembly protein PilO [Solimonas aquatica]|uniref:Tfp pilus assembly protein PilO n=1 Tax=Solimonas aquatica TaxID=489703 RepID=A0A1H9KU85_9GAMM|nr:type 4a pilus biogenesis protein PilO [Solimonas aquatica]SER02618.1 Tfp pilus assembly protein PilO [Solimonas aquatica]
MTALHLPWLPERWRAAQRWPPRWRRLLQMLVFTAACVLLAPWLLLPGWQRWQQQREQTQALSKQSQEQALRLQALRKQQAGDRSLQADYERALRALAGTETAGLLHALEELRAAHGLRQDSYEPLPAIHLDCCDAPGYRLSLSGAYGELRGWLDDLPQLSELLLIEQMHWQLQSENDNQVLRLSLVLRHYRPAEGKSP